MKSDIQGCSSCPKGQEHFEFFASKVSKRELVQYDYRHPDGDLFSTVAPSLEIARARRDQWLEEREHPAEQEAKDFEEEQAQTKSQIEADEGAERQERLYEDEFENPDDPETPLGIELDGGNDPYFEIEPPDNDLP